MLKMLLRKINNNGTKTPFQQLFKTFYRSLSTTSQQFKMRNILEMSTEEKKEFINSFDDVMADCDGTIWTNIGPIDGVGQAVNTLKTLGKKFSYMSNNSIRSNESYMKQFKNSGIEVKLDEILHPSLAIIHYLKQRQFNGLIYVIGSTNLKNEFLQAGFKIISGPEVYCEENGQKFLELVLDKEPVEAVVLDMDYNLTRLKLIRAELYLKNPKCEFFVGITDMKYPIQSIGTNIIGMGPFYKMLEDACNRKATIVGKPGHALKDICLDKFKIKNSKRVLFVGDILEQDIGFGKLCGFQTMVVLTGGTALEDLLDERNANQLPDYYANNFGDLNKILDEIKL